MILATSTGAKNTAKRLIENPASLKLAIKKAYTDMSINNLQLPGSRSEDLKKSAQVELTNATIKQIDNDINILPPLRGLNSVNLTSATITCNTFKPLRII